VPGFNTILFSNSLDGIADYKILRPILFVLQFALLPTWIVFTHYQFFKLKNEWKRPFGMIIFVMLSDLIILLAGIFSFLVWMDLADGKTSFLLP